MATGQLTHQHPSAPISTHQIGEDTPPRLEPADSGIADDALLEDLTKDGKMDYAEWPSLLERLLLRLEHIAYNDFPTPSIPLPGPLPPSLKEEHISIKGEPPLKEPFRERLSIQEESGNTHHEAPGDEEQASIKADPSTEESKPSIKRESSSPTSNSAVLAPANTLPPPLLSLLSTIQSTLRFGFPTAPPHTAQRLAELLLHPTKHYKTLPSYLRALDRIVSVASPASIFPLPTLTPAATTNGRLLNGTSSPSPDPTDKDFIGGAELTEIPWIHNKAGSPTHVQNGPTSDLRTQSTSVIDGPHGAGSVETVTVNVNGVHGTSPRDGSDDGGNSITHGITQGELLRQEQEAGIVPVPAAIPNGRVTRSSAAASAAATRAVGGVGGIVIDDVADSEEEETEPVHARGPDVIGMEDTGPQTPGSGLAGGIDLAGALGRRGEGETMAATIGRVVAQGDEQEREQEQRGEEKDGNTDSDGDSTIAHADGVPEDHDEGADLGGDNRGPDAVDSTAL